MKENRGVGSRGGRRPCVPPDRQPSARRLSHRHRTSDVRREPWTQKIVQRKGGRIAVPTVAAIACATDF